MRRDESLPPEPLPLTEASVQEIQLELIRRWQFNEFDGPKIVASLRRHRGFWRAVMMDRLGFISAKDDRSCLGLIKLRDLPANIWNVDYLYIMTDTLQQARKLERIAQDEHWQADNVQIMESEDERSHALGTSAPAYVISFWWD